MFGGLEGIIFTRIILMPWALCIDQELGRKRRALGQQEDSWLEEIQACRRAQMGWLGILWYPKRHRVECGHL